VYINAHIKSYVGYICEWIWQIIFMQGCENYNQKTKKHNGKHKKNSDEIKKV